MIRPPCGDWSRIMRNAALAHRNMPFRLTATTERPLLPGEVAEIGARHVAAGVVEQHVEPAEFRGFIAANSAATCVGIASRRWARPACVPAFAMPAVSSSASLRRPASTTVQPSFSSASAAARPTPLPAPVTTATRSAMFVLLRSVGTSLDRASGLANRPARILNRPAGAPPLGDDPKSSAAADRDAPRWGIHLPARAQLARPPGRHGDRRCRAGRGRWRSPRWHSGSRSRWCRSRSWPGWSPGRRSGSSSGAPGGAPGEAQAAASAGADPAARPHSRASKV